MTKATGPTVAGIKLLDNTEFDLLDRDEDHLRDPFTGLYFVAVLAAI
jgi:hypothetical protein